MPYLALKFLLDGEIAGEQAVTSVTAHSGR